MLNDLPGSSLILVYASSALASDELLDELLHPRVIVAVVGIQALVVRVAGSLALPLGVAGGGVLFLPAWFPLREVLIKRQT